MSQLGNKTPTKVGSILSKRVTYASDIPAKSNATKKTKNTTRADRAKDHTVRRIASNAAASARDILQRSPLGKRIIRPKERTDSENGASVTTETHTNEEATDRIHTPTPNQSTQIGNVLTADSDMEDDMSEVQSRNITWGDMEDEFNHSKPADANDIDTAVNMIQDHAESIQNDTIATIHRILAGEMKTILTQFTAQQRDTNSKLEEILKQNSNLNTKIRDIENKLNEANKQNHAMRQTIAELIAAGQPNRDDSCTNMKQKQGGRDSTTNETRPNARPTTSSNQPGKTKSTTPNKVTAAHHPSRLVVRFEPEGIQEHDKISPEELTKNINHAMRNANVIRTSQGIPTKDPPLVVAARYTERNSSLVISTREDQTADQLMEFFDDFKGALAIDTSKYKLVAYGDKKWFKIQVDNVATLDYYGNILEPDVILKELTTNNPSVQGLEETGHLTMPPRWLIPTEELKRQSRRRSSFIFTTDLEEKAIKIVKGGHLALFGRYCGVRPFQDRPLIQQCKNCWRYGHFKKSCKNPKACRICSSEGHDESHHQSICSNCKAVAMAEGDEDDEMMTGTCDHHLRCGNCYRAGDTENTAHAVNSRDCPVRKQLYGTARNNEKTAIKKGTLYQVRNKKPRAPKKKNEIVNTIATSNRFSPLYPDNDMVANTSTEQQPTQENNKTARWS